MVQVVFTPNLQRHVSCPPVGVTGSTVAEALSSAFPWTAAWWCCEPATGARASSVSPMGCPQEHAYDICFRHALDVDAGGERLAPGRTTGSLWISENGGDRWECVSSHLPPIYALRFTQ